MSKYKGRLVVPQDEQWTALQQPLRSLGSGSSSSVEDSGHEFSGQKRGERLASSRVMRDNLMHQMESIVLQEAELNSALELLDYTRQRCAQQHGEIVERLERYEKVLHNLQTCGFTDTDLSHPVENLLSEEERVRWEKTKEMVSVVLPEVLSRLEDNIELNNAKIRVIRDKMEELRAKRLTLREDIAVKEDYIAVLLKEQSFY